MIRLERTSSNSLPYPINLDFRLLREIRKLAMTVEGKIASGILGARNDEEWYRTCEGREDVKETSDDYRRA